MAEIRATYRLQLHAGFTFDDAARLAPYLARLGVSHVYCSPYLQAAPGSTHGYDVVDPHRLNEELGGEAGHQRMTEAFRAAGLGQLLDIVPNHMATAGRANAWWWDVLENGPASRYASYFDIDWDPPQRKLIAQVLVPILGDHYGRVLEAGELRVERNGGSFTVQYHEHELPLSPRSIDDVVAGAATRAGSDELAGLASAFGGLPHALSTDRASVIERHRDKELLRQRLAELAERDGAVARALDDEVADLNRDVDRVDELLGRQNYRLAYWRVAGRELDYRRFFDINTLVAVRTEDPAVFDDTHQLVIGLVRDGKVDGVRIDHVDGLRDPLGYLERLRGSVGSDAAVVLEKILEADERLPDGWPVDGTSGYDFLGQVNRLLVEPAGYATLEGVYERFTGETEPFASIAFAAKHEIMRSVLAADVERLTEVFVAAAERHRRYRDFTRSELREALRETIASFSVYRSYVRPGDEPSPADVDRVVSAATSASARRGDLDPELFDFLADLLLLRRPGDLEHELAVRFQQVTAPVMAKAVEDTSFYRYHCLVSLNEVGGDPSLAGLPVAGFHERRRAEGRGGSLLATSTHDTKRSEDVRARIAVLAEVAGPWEEAVWRWAHMNERHRTDGVPDRNAEYLLYQTLVGAWPLSADRAVAYMEKATKEAKIHTSWIDPSPAYDAALRRFVLGVIESPEFVDDLEAFLAESNIVEAGWRNSLVQTALKLTCPGVPDVYQGCELWDLSLVDPDNRRAVDFDARRDGLDEVAAWSLDEAEKGWASGEIKLWLLHRLLELRRDRPELFSPAARYAPLPVEGEGEGGDRVVAFARGEHLVVVATRFPLSPVGLDRVRVRLPAGTWHSVLGGAGATEAGVVADLVGAFPVAVLVDAPR